MRWPIGAAIVPAPFRASASLAVARPAA